MLLFLIVGQLALAQLKVRLFRRQSSHWVALLLFAIQIGLFAISIVFVDYWYAMYLAPVLPYIAFVYFDIRRAVRVSVAVWLGYMALLTYLWLHSPDTLEFKLGVFLQATSMISFFFVLFATTSYTVAREREHRGRTEQVLDQLEQRTSSWHSHHAKRSPRSRSAIAWHVISTMAWGTI